MKSLFPLILFLSIFIIFSSCEQLNDTLSDKGTSKTMEFKPIKVNYPETYKDSTIVDNYHGTEVADPFRWLEEETSAETKDWVKAQNQVTFGYLDKIPFRNSIKDRLKKLWNYERYSTPFKEGGRYYYFKNDGLQNQAVLYGQDKLDADSELILDPNQFSSDGTTSLGGIAFSKNGRYLAYQTSAGGSDWRSIQVKDLSTGEMLEEKLDWIKFSSISWFKEGFYYSRYPQPSEKEILSGASEFHQIYYHKLGTAQSEDDLIFADRSNPKRGFFANTSEDERFLSVNVWESTSGNALYFQDLTKGDPSFIPIIKTLEHDFNVVGNLDDNLLVMTNYKADNNRLIAVNSEKPEEDFWEEILPESEDKLQSVDIIGNKIFATYIHKASSLVKVFDTQGKFLDNLKLPAIGTVGSFSGKKAETNGFFSFTSFNRPTSIYSLNTETLEYQIFKTPEVDFSPDDYVTEQLWFKSADGEEVPMFVTHKKGIEKNGKLPTLLYGYGGFDISILPSFNLTRLPLLENGGVYAVANIRGGGEFGKKWHKAGTKGQKQNVFNDFIAAAEFLISEGYTNSDKLAIEGRSNGGLLVGAVMTQRPDLFKVAFPGVGVLDMLRYDKFTIGRAWAGDYGLSENPKDFDYLYSYSPLHNAIPAKYPATMVTTADHDDRVVPAHSYKFTSAMQASQQGDNPMLIRVETSAGHGAGKPTDKQIDEASDLLSFMFYNFKENVIYENEVAQ